MIHECKVMINKEHGDTIVIQHNWVDLCADCREFIKNQADKTLNMLIESESSKCELCHRHCYRRMG